VLALLAVLPLAAFALAAHRVARARALLGLAAPDPRSGRLAVAALSAVPVLLGLAAAQPALERSTRHEFRTDAQAMVVIDVSRSMRAASGPDRPSRLVRAKDAAIAIRDALATVPTGVASMTDRVLPHLFPSPDRDPFVETVRRAVAPESPPPRETAPTATTLAALGEFARGNVFGGAAPRRALVVLTDGESRPFAESAVARALAAEDIRLVLVHVWDNDEAVYAGGREPERLYRPDPASRPTLERLAGATGGRVFAEDELQAAGAAAVRALGRGPTARRGRETRTTPLAPYVALAALLPLALVLRHRNFR
jgi:VWA domain-containing protein